MKQYCSYTMDYLINSQYGVLITDNPNNRVSVVVAKIVPLPYIEILPDNTYKLCVIKM